MSHHPRRSRSGRIEVICGPMFSGKTEEMIRRLRREKIAGRHPLVMIPPRGRYAHKIESRQGQCMDARLAKYAEQAFAHLKEREQDDQYAVIAFDEAHWFDDLWSSATALANAGHRVIVSGLDMDYRGQPFVPMAMTMASAEQVTKLTAVGRCDCDATHTARIGDGDDEGGAWEPMCRLCWRETCQE